MHSSIFTLTSLLTLAQAFYPQWQYGINLKGQLYCARANDRATSQIAITQAPSNQIWQITSLCKGPQGGLINPDECHHSIITTAAAFGMAVLYWKQASYWGGAGQKRSISTTSEAFSSDSTATTDSFLSRIPDHISISNIKVNNAPLTANTSSPTHRRIKRDVEKYNVFYNGTLPLTFVIHHPIKPTTGARTRRAFAETEMPTEIPLFAATDGQNMYLSHIEPTNSSSIPNIPLSPSSSVQKRSGFDGYNYVGVGGLKLQSISDPVSQWQDVMNWIDAPTEQGGLSPYGVMLWQAQYAGWIGHSFLSFVHDKQTGKGYNGQWAMAAEVGNFGHDWDPNWNWCWGVFAQNC